MRMRQDADRGPGNSAALSPVPVKAAAHWFPPGRGARPLYSYWVQ